MGGSTLKVEIGNTTYLIDDPKLDGGLKATVSAVSEETSADGGNAIHTLNCDRFNLDKAKEREALAIRRV